MMVQYREKFDVNGRTYGIEDTTDVENRLIKSKRFALWASGCGIGSTDTIAEARSLLHSYITSQLRAESAGWKERAMNSDRTLNKLGEDSFGLGKFQVFIDE